MYSIEYSREAFKSLKAMPRNLATTVREKIEQLAAAPHGPNNNVKKLQGRSGLSVARRRLARDLRDS
ncbi:type II toxin-antitoxin system RelE family toxin [Thiomonas delicata]|uniref:Uncharacterized protein n=2 Tax=Thiomonas TaxID=32012 RepID=A0A238D2W7_THIDL|nr:hypothetical protein [Thiomonas delicata]SBP87616.1 conserved hypothetical protein [Thiomonas delicata]